MMDLGSDVRRNPKISGTKHNVFGIQTGVAIAFFVRDKVPDGACATSTTPAGKTAEVARDKLAYSEGKSTAWDIDIPFESITPAMPRTTGSTSPTATSSSLIPLADRQTKLAKNPWMKKQAVFGLYSVGHK